MTTIDHILAELRRGVDDQTWERYVPQLQEQGVQVRDGVATASGGHAVALHVGWPNPYHVERDAVGRWYLVSPVPGTSGQP
jgi:hypothetical protein